MPKVIEIDGAYWFHWQYAAALLGMSKPKFNALIDSGGIATREGNRGQLYVPEDGVTTLRQARNRVKAERRVKEPKTVKLIDAEPRVTILRDRPADQGILDWRKR